MAIVTVASVPQTLPVPSRADDARRCAATGRYNRPVMDHRLDEIARRYDIALIVRFGSTVSGREHARSDVDVGVLFAQMPTLQVELDVTADLQQVFGPREVDLVVLNRADPLLLKQITDRAVLEYGTAERLDALARYAFKRYHDHRPYFEMEREYVARALERASLLSHGR